MTESSEAISFIKISFNRLRPLNSEFQMEKNVVYFPGLNTIRFIAAFVVIINHIEKFKKILGQPNYEYVDTVFSWEDNTLKNIF